jgi:hypothetical protein
MKRIITNPDENGQWVAYLDDYELKHGDGPRGCGASELEAMLDLAEQVADRRRDALWCQTMEAKYAPGK